MSFAKGVSPMNIYVDESSQTLPFETSIDFWRTSKFTGEGTLKLDSNEYLVKTKFDVGKFISITVVVKKEAGADADERNRIALAVAERGVLKDSWRYLCVNPASGEIAYTTTLTCNLTGDAVDGFIDATKAFLRKHFGEIEEICKSAAVDEAEEPQEPAPSPNSSPSPSPGLNPSSQTASNDDGVFDFAAFAAEMADFL